MTGLSNLLFLVALAMLLICAMPFWLRRRPNHAPALLVIFGLIAALMAFDYPMLKRTVSAEVLYKSPAIRERAQVKEKVYDIAARQKWAFSLLMLALLGWLWAERSELQLVCRAVIRGAGIWCAYEIQTFHSLTVSWRAVGSWSFPGDFYSWDGCYVLCVLSVLALVGAIWARWMIHDGSPADAPPIDFRELHRQGRISADELRRAEAKRFSAAA